MKKQFQGLRFLAFLLVFGAHASCFRWLDYNWSSCGAWAVSFFFALSGFMIGFGDRGAPFSWGGAVRYVWGKIKRFYPLLILSLVLSTRFWKGLFCWVTGGNPCPEFWGCLPIRHLLLVQSWWRDGVYEFNAASWFLSTIIVLYLVARLALPMLRRCGTAGLALSALGSFAVVAGWNVFVFSHGWDSRYWLYIFPPAKVPEFVGFICLGLICARCGDRLSALLGGVLPGTLVDFGCAALLVGSLAWYDNGNGSVFQWQVPNVLIFCLFTFSGGLFSRFCGCRAMDVLGSLSMPAFLLHGNVINFVQGRLASFGMPPQTPAGQCLWFWVAFALSVAAGYAYLRIGGFIRGRFGK